MEPPKVATKQNASKTLPFFENKMKVVPIYDCLETYGDAKAYLELKGTRVDDFDLLIGATAIKHNLIMVTDNIKYLGRIPNIQITNWK